MLRHVNGVHYESPQHCSCTNLSKLTRASHVTTCNGTDDKRSICSRLKGGLRERTYLNLAVERARLGRQQRAHVHAAGGGTPPVSTGAAAATAAGHLGGAAFCTDNTTSHGGRAPRERSRRVRCRTGVARRPPTIYLARAASRCVSVTTTR